MQVARGEALCQVAEDEGDEPLEDEEEAEVLPCLCTWQI
jgi:hypothetical protein